MTTLSLIIREEVTLGIPLSKEAKKINQIAYVNTQISEMKIQRKYSQMGASYETHVEQGQELPFLKMA